MKVQRKDLLYRSCLEQRRKNKIFLASQQKYLCIVMKHPQMKASLGEGLGCGIF